ncbi:hypothetical protein FO519_000440 [Halicephalobus sp. NKZ332]|nr:hypothetical protein FO519_000440 [Halicephalobus sp. NKZ332]
MIQKIFDYGAPDKMKRPLGMRFSPWFPDLLYFVDAYQGIFILDTVKKQISSLFGNSSMPYLNDFDFLWDEDLVLSEPSTTFSDDMFHRIALESKPSGRLLRYRPGEKKVSVILDGLYTPNGVQAGPDRKSVYFSEMMAYRIQRVDFDESTKYQTTVVLDGLPGMPDNIRLSNDQRTLMVPLPEERIDFPLNWPVIKQYMLFVS